MTAAVGRRITPTGLLVMSADAIERDREGWLRQRECSIGGSDVPRILGLYPSPLRVWHDKRGELPPVADDDPGQTAARMRWGRRLEAAVADEWTMRNRSVTRRMGLLANADNPTLTCTIDRRVLECPLPAGGRNVCSLEIKNTGLFSSKRWRRAVPDAVLAQCFHSMRVTGDDHQHVAVKVDGDLADYRQFAVYRDGADADVYDLVCAEVDAFAAAHMPAGEKPAPPPMADEGDLYDVLHPDRSGVKHLGAMDAVDALAAREEYRQTSRAASEAKTAQKAAKSRLLAYAGDAEIIAADNDLLFTYLEVNGRPAVDLELLAEHYPDAYAACVTPSTHRMLNVSGKSNRR